MINEHDLADFERLDPVPLYQVRPKSYIAFSHDGKEHVVFFSHLDGAYSYCVNKDNSILHLSANMLVTPFRPL